MIDSKSGEAKMYGEAEKLVASRKAEEKKLDTYEETESEEKEEKEDEQLTEIFAGQEDETIEQETVEGGEDGK
jgi:hypothetical protein